MCDDGLVFASVLDKRRAFGIRFSVICGNVMHVGCRIFTPQVVRTPLLKRCLCYLVLDFQRTIQVTLNAIGFSSRTCHSLML